MKQMIKEKTIKTKKYLVLVAAILGMFALLISACGESEGDEYNEGRENNEQSSYEGTEGSNGENGEGTEGSEGSESGEGNEHGNEGSESSSSEGSERSSGENEVGDIASSPVLDLTESWDGVINGLQVSMSYDSQTQTFSGVLENVSSQKLCSILLELNLKQGTQTVVELGPQNIGDIVVGAQVNARLLVADEPAAAGLSFDAWQVHPEINICGQSSSESNEGSSGESREGSEGSESGEGSEHGSEGSEGSSSEGSEGSESGSATEEGGRQLQLTQTYDQVRSGVRLQIGYDSEANAFIGTAQNTTSQIIQRVRVEVHLTQGTSTISAELGPTTPTDIQPGETLEINLSAAGEVFSDWSPHAETGSGEGAESPGS